MSVDLRGNSLLIGVSVHGINHFLFGSMKKEFVTLFWQPGYYAIFLCFFYWLIFCASTYNSMSEYMQKALELASEALQAQEVPVGCVFVVEDTIVAGARNRVNETRNPTRHAEINCIDSVLQYCKDSAIDYKQYFKNVSVYVTVEPCVMCAAALNNVAVKEVIYGCVNDRFGGKTVLDVNFFYENSYKLSGDIFTVEAMGLLKEFYKGSNPLAPDVKSKKKLQS